jgi:phosphoenolpyruvate carboxykinase (ATP)
MLENVGMGPDGVTPDYDDGSRTENTRVSYPLHHIPGAVESGRGGHPTDIFFLTCDAYGVLPPISRLDKGQTMYHFLSGYTAKVAGTEVGITEPQVVFSACFGAPFMPLHPTRYAEMLGERMEAHGVRVWLVNTGWTGGSYGEGHRMKLRHTRALLTAAMCGALDGVQWATDPVFGLKYPLACPDVPSEVLDPRSAWKDAAAFDATAKHLAGLFRENFAKFEAQASAAILVAAPVA